MGLGEGTKDDQATILKSDRKNNLILEKAKPRSEHSLARLNPFFFFQICLDVFEINEVSYELATTEFGVDKWMI